MTFNHGVEGSSPSALTNKFNTLDRGCHFKSNFRVTPRVTVWVFGGMLLLILATIVRVGFPIYGGWMWLKERR